MNWKQLDFHKMWVSVGFFFGRIYSNWKCENRSIFGLQRKFSVKTVQYGRKTTNVQRKYVKAE